MSMMKTKFALGLITLANLATYAMSIRLFGFYVVPVIDMTETPPAPPMADMILGADRDDWGCITSAGYSWCNHTNACIPVGYDCSPFTKVLGVDKDKWGCITSAGYAWCNETSTCLPMNEMCAVSHM
jgi:hypothetical protein